MRSHLEVCMYIPTLLSLAEVPLFIPHLFIEVKLSFVTSYHALPRALGRRDEDEVHQRAAPHALPMWRNFQIAVVARRASWNDLLLAKGSNHVVIICMQRS